MKLFDILVRKVDTIKIIFVAYILAGLNSIYQVTACGYYQKFIDLDEVNGAAWLLSFAAFGIVGLPIVIQVADEYGRGSYKSSDENTQLNAIIWATILNIAAFIVNGMYFSVVI